mmetsp:Transcript_4914/g.14207  ORF Transcript_4914/g.14207 Transcript_4914/m.14207 type:complete len:592 (+) Transcript_4914:195-1970(+)
MPPHPEGRSLHKPLRPRIHPHVPSLLAFPDWTPGTKASDDDDDDNDEDNANGKHKDNDDDDDDEAKETANHSEHDPFLQVVWPGEGKSRMIPSNLTSSIDGGNTMRGSCRPICIHFPILVRDTPESIGMKLPRGVRSTGWNPPNNRKKSPATMNPSAKQQQQQQQQQRPQPTREEIAASEKRRAALHNAPPSTTGVGEYGYAYNHQAYDESSPTPQYSSSFRGPSTPSAGSTLGSTPPGYLLSGTPSLGSYLGGGLIPPARAPSTAHAGTTPTGGGASVTPPFVRPLGFSGHAPTESTPKPVATTAAASTLRPSGTAPAPGSEGSTGPPPSSENDHKPSLDLLHSSPFDGIGGGSSHQRDGLSFYLQAEENASMAAATTYIHDFYQHHYHHPLGGDEADGDHHQCFGHHHLPMDPDSAMTAAGAASSNAGDIFDGGSDHHLYHNPDYAGGLALDAEDMPFAVDGISSSAVAPSQHAGASASSASMPSLQASLVASMGMAAPKRLTMFENKSKQNTAVPDTSVQAHSQTTMHPLSNNNNSNNNNNINLSDDNAVDSLADQLADFKSFGASLMVTSGVNAAPAPLTASVGSGG